jgi:hypothetical protein
MVDSLQVKHKAQSHASPAECMCSAERLNISISYQLGYLYGSLKLQLTMCIAVVYNLSIAHSFRV